MKTYSNIEKAKTQLVLRHSYFATVLMSLPLIEDTTIPTAATDGTCIIYNPDFMGKLTTEEIMFVLAHEVMHVTMLHPWRREGRDPKKWNMAADHAENIILIDAGFTTPKIGILADPQYKDMHAEKVYNMLPEGDDGSGDGEGQGDGGFRDECMDAPGDAADKAQSEAKAKNIITQAAKVAKMQGQLSGALKELIDDTLAPKVNWREELRRFMTASLKTDQSWARGQRRFLADGLYLPSLYSEGMGEIVVGVDTSGSVWDMVPEFLAEVSAIAAECRPEKIHVVYCDTEVNAHDEYEPGEEIEAKRVGGGGTSLQRAFDYIQVKGIEPKVMVFITDLETSLGAEPDYPVVWAVTGDLPAPYGDRVQV
jgi:predicted metal-dependent peptidase